MASTYLEKTLSGTSTNRKLCTFSYWVKRSNISDTRQGCIGGFLTNSSGQNLQIGFFDNSFYAFYYDGTITRLNLISSALARDVSAWYHVVIAIDTTQATTSDRAKMYVNGVQVTSFTNSDYPVQNIDFPMTNGFTTHIGKMTFIGSTTEYFDGSMAHVHFIDGTAYTPSAFGETDSTTGIWKPKTAPSVTYGTNGFFLKFENSGAFGTDSSGNSNTFTVNGTMTQTLDTPSNVFATWNPLAIGDFTNNATLSNGNTYYSSDTAGYNIRAGTLGASSGKWYWEGKFISHNPTTSPGMPLEIIATDVPIGTNIAGGQAPYYYSYSYDGSNGIVRLDSVETNYGTTILNTVGQIGMVAMDLDNNKVYFGVNGTWTNSADPSAGTGGFSITDPADTPLGFYMPAISDRSSARAYDYAFNFGNGYFGTTPVSSAQNPDDGIGIFEYDVPTGYRALCTKSINAEEYS